MWTPKRIVLLTGGFVLFALVYVVYSITSLGRINSLPPLPEQYQPSANADGGDRVIRSSTSVLISPLERKLEQAFGKNCTELSWPNLFELNSKSMVLAAKDVQPKDGRIYLAPFSLALFGKNKNDGRGIEITTLRCKEAYIRLDEKVNSFVPGELSGRKLIEAELWGDASQNIVITNNRRTPSREDDLVVTIASGPLYYFETLHRVRTSDYVHLKDGLERAQGKRIIPPKADVRGKGMEMELATAPPPSRPGQRPIHKPKEESISGVKRIVLKEQVSMHLCVAGGSPFPSGDKTRPAAANKPTPAAEPAHVTILSPGRFEYEIFKDHDFARFDVPSDDDSVSPQDVTVQRTIAEGESQRHDLLVCKHLELRIKRRDNDPSANTGQRDAGSVEQGLEIETVHAIGPDVTLTSDAEKLDAHGTDFFHDTVKKLSILKGVPYVEANKEDNVIQVPELRIQEVPLPAAAKADKNDNGAAKTYQQIQAIGRGCIHITNKSSDKPTVHAYWNEKLLSTRDLDLDLDQLILTGSARFVDDEHKQELKAETLKVWLLSEDNKPTATAQTVAGPSPQPLSPEGRGARGEGPKQAGAAQSSRRPHHVEALRNVKAQSPTLNIPAAARLIVRFRDVPPELMPPPSSADHSGQRSPQDKPSASGSAGASRAVAAGGTPALREGTQSAPPPTPQVASAPTLASPARGGEERGAAAAKTTKSDEQRPIDLSARSIEADVLRCEERLVLDHLWAEGGSLDNIDKRDGVTVHQEPANPGEQGVNISGNTLEMQCTPKGNVLTVTGDLAHLQMDKMLILGPEVKIDQVQNKAWVQGAGAMQMESNTTLENKRLQRPVPLRVHWSQWMFFDGAFAEFDGNIQADQENARLACRHLQVKFDRPISLKEGSRGDQPAKVSKLVGDKDVRVEDQTFEGRQLNKYQLLTGVAVEMNTEPRDELPPPLSPPDPREAKRTAKTTTKNSDANRVKLSGPGSVRILQRGGADPTANPLAPANPAAAEQEMKLTYVTFEKQMQASTLTNVATFWEAVRVINLPCDDPHRDIDLDALVVDLPPGAMYLRCNNLRVQTFQSNGRTYQRMEARGQVFVKGQDYTASCDRMTFNEEKDQVIFFGERGNQAVLSKRRGKGEAPQVFRAETIQYVRSTGAMSVPVLGSGEG